MFVHVPIFKRNNSLYKQYQTPSYSPTPYFTRGISFQKTCIVNYLFYNLKQQKHIQTLPHTICFILADNMIPKIQIHILTFKTHIQ